MKTYALTMIGICIFSLVTVLSVFAIYVHNYAHPESDLGTFQFRKTIDFEYFKNHINSDRESEHSSDKDLAVADDVLKQRWQDYRTYSLQTIEHGAAQGIFTTFIWAAFLMVTLSAHVGLYRRTWKVRKSLEKFRSYSRAG